MKIFTCIILLFFSVCIQAKVIYVKVDGNGNGTSWSDAMGNLAAALESATFGDHVWVARGIYYPTDKAERTATFEVFDGVQVYGGFIGTETTLEQRDWVKHKTILSGEIGTSSIDDNSYNVLYTRNVSESTLVDGFIITKGNANGTGEKGSMERSGAGWYNEAKDGKSNPTIVNCTFIHNVARDGAGLYNIANEGVCNPKITNCQFMENKADLDGGAMYNDSRLGSICNPIIKDCKFINNEATYGGGILNHTSNGESSPSVIGCSFEDNIGYIRGGSIFSSEEGGRCSPIITSSFFSDNKATVGKDVNEEQVVSKGILKKM